MKKRVFAAATAAMMTVSALGSVTAGAFEQTSYAEDVSVYVNGQKSTTVNISLLLLTTELW